jgi:hypothetical protein
MLERCTNKMIWPQSTHFAARVSVALHAPHMQLKFNIAPKQKAFLTRTELGAQPRSAAQVGTICTATRL